MPPRLLTLALLALTLSASPPAPAADVEAGRGKAEPCAVCHGPDGNATTSGTPSLAGMPAYYTHWQLIMFRDGRRRDPQMSPFAERLSDADMADLAAYYAAQRPRARSTPSEVGKFATGRPLADAHHCTSCHGPGLIGQQQVPRLAGQDLDYLLKRLRGYRAKTTSDLDGMMTMVAESLTEQEIETLAHYIAALPPAP
ncbi:MAG: cytochrome c4 [Candidatus Rokubacteria bacterium]|nr:cytochrome c4 [Candidatus Rokubacteria bacterium]